MAAINNIMMERRRLTHTFNELRDYRILAVCAPAGYGKTVAVTQWLERDARAKAFLSADRYDNDLSSFSGHFCAALHICQPRNQALNAIISHPSFHSAPEEFALRAISALSSRKQAVLVIDDLRLIHNDEVLKLILIFIKRLPKNFQIILISRHDLPPHFSDLRLKYQIASIGIEELLFNDDEVKELYRKRGRIISSEHATDINKLTYGWAIGINAFFLSDKNTFKKIYDYLDDFVRINIWAEWNDSARNFMIRTSNLRELTPSICEAMTGVVQSGSFLKVLMQKGAFITQLQDDVYRYHNLFQQFLKRIAKGFGEEFMYSLLSTEGHWHLSQKDFYSAVDCFIRCKNHDGIEKCFVLLRDYSGSHFMVEMLLPILKHQEVLNAAEKYPQILHFIAFCAFIEGRIDDMVLYMDRYYAEYSEISSEDSTYMYGIFHMRMLDFRIKLHQIISEAESLPCIPDYNIPQRILILHSPMPHREAYEWSEMAIGDVEENVKASIPKVGWMFGEEANILAESLMAGLLYEKGHLDKAHAHALNFLAETKKLPAEAKFGVMSLLVCVLDAYRDTDEATVVMQSIMRMIEEDKAYHLYYNFNSFAARREFHVSGRFSPEYIKASEEWLEKKIFDNLPLWELYAAFTACRAFIANGKYNSALILLNKSLKIACEYNRTLDIIEAQILLAIVYRKKQGKFQNEALDYLYEAVCAAFPCGYVQLFINDGAELAGLLNKLINRGKQQKAEDAKLLSFIKLLYLKTRDKQYNEPAEGIAEEPEKFTDKQKAVMRLLCQGKSYNEMAEKLGIKHSSIRSRLERIYSKLDVTNGIDAVTKINALKLLD